MTEFTATQISDFHKALNSAKDSMSSEQQELLRAVLLLAWAAVEEEDKLTSGFTGSFTPEQGSLLTEFVTGAGTVALRPQVFRGFIKLT